MAELLARVAPVLGFLVAITVVAELSDRAGVFRAAADAAARVARGRVWVLWASLVVLATVSTVVLSLDTTAVLLTPVVLATAQRLRLPATGLALATVWLANTASLLLPVSNLTNLLAWHRLQAMDVGVLGYVRVSWAPALTAVVVTALVLVAMFGRQMLGRYTSPRPERTGDRVLLALASVVCLLLVPAFLTGVAVVWPATAAALLLVVAFGWRDASALRWSLLPFRVVGIVLVLLLVADWAGDHLLRGALSGAAGQGESFGAYLRLAAVGAFGANAIDNLPAYLAIEPVADSSPARLVALLIGVNAGPLLTPWASLATLLWHDRCRAAGVTVSWRGFTLRGLVAVPLLLLACTAALALIA
ncbi:MAG TPA: SLC13 family permease [Actinomycetales bacterium]|nr:SLC13 family permease [Actinomycetales bacterium]